MEKSPRINTNFTSKNLLEPRDLRLTFETNKVGHNQDIFDFGLLLLQSVIGESDFLNFTEFKRKLDIFIEDYNKRPKENRKFCCVLHDEQMVNSVDFQPFDVDVEIRKADKLTSVVSSLQDIILTKNFSKYFIELLCNCLKFDPNSRLSASSLLKLRFFHDQKTLGPLTSLSDLIKISHQLNVLPDKYQAASEKQLEKLCNALSVLLSQSDLSSKQDKENKKDHLLERLTIDSLIVEDLAFDLGLQPVKVWQHLTRVGKDL